MTSERPTLKLLSATEVWHLVDSLRDHAAHPLLVIAVRTGARLSDVAGVRRLDVDLSHQTIAVPSRPVASRNVLRGVSSDHAPELGES